MRSMGKTIADAIRDSNYQFTFCYSESKIDAMPLIVDTYVEKLRRLVELAGGPAEFARKYSQDGADKPIDPTYVSQILNGHRAFRDIARRNMAIRAGLAPDYFDPRPELGEPAAIYNLWPAIVTQIAEIVRDLPEPMQNQILGQAKMLQTEFRVSKNNPSARSGK